MTLAAVLFAIAAVGGAAMAFMRFQGRELPPAFLTIVHGLFAAVALILLILAVAGGAASALAKVALGGFILAALGGFYLVTYHLRKQVLPIPVVGAHGLVAVVSFVILLAAIFAVR